MSKFAVMAFVFACITVFGISVLMRDRLCLIVISHGDFLRRVMLLYEGSYSLVISRFNCVYSGLELSAQLKTPQDII